MASCLTIITRRWLEVPSTLNRPCVETAQLENWPILMDFQRPWVMYEPGGCARQQPSWSRCERLWPLSQGRNASRTWFVIDMYALGQSWGHHPVPLVSCAPSNVVVGCMACTHKQLQRRSGFDFGFPVPTAVRNNDSLYAASQGEVLRRCHASRQLPADRRVAAVFRGSSRRRSTRVRTRLLTLDGTRVSDELGDIQVTLTDMTPQPHAVSNATNRNAMMHRYSFDDGLRHAQFGFAPRGDSLFSFRFSEVLAAGLIPIVVSDGWELPFADLIDWSEVAIVVPEAEVHTVPQLLANWTLSRVCKTRVRAYEVYTQYLASPERWVRAVEEILRHPRYAIPAPQGAPAMHARGEVGWSSWLNLSGQHHHDEQSGAMAPNAS